MKRSVMRKVLLTIVCLTLVFTAACGTANRSGPSGVQTEDVDERLLTAHNAFAFQLYEEIVSEDAGENVFISPLSVSLALSMTYNGAADETQAAMADTLQVEGLSIEELNEANAALKSVIEQADPDVELSIANSLWGREGTPFKADFLDRNEQFYDAQVTELDFNDPQASATINDWVHDQTNGKIEDIVDDNIDPASILFLINAIYFKGEWAEPFDKALTQDQDFHLLDGTTKTVPMMAQSGEYQYYEGDGFSAIQLPYGNERLSMNIFLPDESSSLEQFHEQLNEQNWQKWMDSFEMTEGDIQLPRFQLEYEKQLNAALTALGMGVAFDELSANFERMADLAQLENVYLAEVKHKSFIEVNEAGSEAAAATSVEMRVTSAPVDFFVMTVDRPFFFTIQDNETGTLLFMGSVVEPE